MPKKKRTIRDEIKELIPKYNPEEHGITIKSSPSQTLIINPNERIVSEFNHEQDHVIDIDLFYFDSLRLRRPIPGKRLKRKDNEKLFNVLTHFTVKHAPILNLDFLIDEIKIDKKN